MDSFQLFAKKQTAAVQQQNHTDTNLLEERDNSLVRLSWSSETNAQFMAMGVADKLNFSATNMPLQPALK